MRFAIVSCIHANLPALEAVLQDARQMRCDSILCLGDIVGYYDQPKECLDLVRSHCQASVKGNHDEYCSGLYPLSNFNPGAAEKIEWTRRQLSPADQQWLRDLPYYLDIGDFTVVHASLDIPMRWPYVFDKLGAAPHFTFQTRALCFNGHTHVPVAFEFKKGAIKGGTYTRFKLKRGIKYLVNVGGVGQPRDGRPGAAYAVYDTTSRIVESRRIDYPRPPSGGHPAITPLRGGGGPPKTSKAHLHQG